MIGGSLRIVTALALACALAATPAPEAWADPREQALSALADLDAALRRERGGETAMRLAISRARARAAELARAAPNDPDINRAYALVLATSGRLLARIGDAAPARGAYRQALAIFRSAATARPSEATALDLSGALMEIGAFEARLRAHDAARDAFAEAAATLRAAGAATPKKPLLAAQLSDALGQLSDVELRRGAGAAARAAIDEAIALDRALTQADPDAAHVLDLHRRHLVRRAELLETGDPAAARADLEAALALRRRLAELEPDKPARVLSLVAALTAAGDWREAAGDQAGARAAHQEATRRAGALFAAKPKDRIRREELQHALRAYGAFLERAGEIAAARKAQDEARALGRALER